METLNTSRQFIVSTWNGCHFGGPTLPKPAVFGWGNNPSATSVWKYEPMIYPGMYKAWSQTTKTEHHLVQLSHFTQETPQSSSASLWEHKLQKERSNDNDTSLHFAILSLKRGKKSSLSPSYPPPSLRTVTGGKVRFTLPHRRGYSNHQWWRSQELGSSASKWDCEAPRWWIRMNFANVQTSNPSLQNMVRLCGTVYCSRIWIIAHGELPVVPYWWVKIWMGLNKEFVGMERPYLEGTMDSVIIFWDVGLHKR